MLSKKFLKEVELLHYDTESGAAKIAEKSLSILQEECLRIEGELNESILKTAIQLLLNTHPMASIENAIIPVYAKIVKNIKSGIFTQKIIQNVFYTHKNEMMKNEEYTINSLFEYLKDKHSILTLSHSSTILSAFRKLARNGYYDKEIYILESRPLREGEKTALLISKENFSNIHFGVDFAVNEFANNAELAVLGADTIYQDGTILNKIGSATIAELFYSRSKEVIIAASSSKISLKSIYFKDFKPIIPHRALKEILMTIDQNVTIWNKYFEIIDPKYINTLIINEKTFSYPFLLSFFKYIKEKGIDFLAKTLNEIYPNADKNIN